MSTHVACSGNSGCAWASHWLNYLEIFVLDFTGLKWANFFFGVECSLTLAPIFECKGGLMHVIGTIWARFLGTPTAIILAWMSASALTCKSLPHKITVVTKPVFIFAKIQGGDGISLIKARDSEGICKITSFLSCQQISTWHLDRSNEIITKTVLSTPLSHVSLQGQGCGTACMLMGSSELPLQDSVRCNNIKPAIRSTGQITDSAFELQSHTKLEREIRLLRGYITLSTSKQNNVIY
ncbi:hypothetical protein VNO77_43980 [Canavalia gladiata]|uniref:Uncharacterized protein n=1 Tax=Canavalia gladiata TaxID=3824 RepID=A0AAN9PQB7_CANGL